MNDNLRVVRCARPFAAAAAFLRECDLQQREKLLCFAAHEGEAAALRAAFAEVANGLSPPVVALPRMSAAAANGVAAAELATAARLSAADSSAVRRKLAMEIFTHLREMSPPQFAPSELFSRAASLAAFLEEFVESRPTLQIASDSLPQLCAQMQHDGAMEDEAKAVSLLWEILYPRLHSARDVLADFAAAAPPIVYAGFESPPWLPDFLQRCKNGAMAFLAEEESAPDAETILANDANSLRVSHIVRCRETSSASLHQAAELALSALCDFAANGAVGIVVYDRLLARRLRAVAECENIRIEDDGGWRMETLSFGGALRQWTDAVCAFSPAQFGNILYPPFWAGQKDRVAAASAWQKLLAGYGELPRTLFAFSRFNNFAFAPFAKKMADANRRRPNGESLRDWVLWLLSHSESPLAAWKNDSVAAVLRAELSAASGEEKMQTSEFRAWLHSFMREKTGGELGISSCACFVPPTTTRRFDSIILLGARGDNLPPPPDFFWGENGRRALQLPGRGEYVAQKFMQFSRLTAAHSNIAAVWQSGSDGRDSQPSPFWTLLADAYKKSGKIVEDIPARAAPPPSPDVHPPVAAAGIMRVAPRTIRVTAVSDLMRCPYKFFAENILQLGEEEGDEVLQPMARGTLLHLGMKQFAENAGDETNPEKLLAIWKSTFSALPAVRAGAKLAIQHWLLRGESFVAAESERRIAGWRPRFLEHSFSAQLPGANTILRGRIDRVDRNESENKWAVIDYKSGGGPSKTEMQTGEEPQLPLYAFLLGEPESFWRVCYPAHEDGDTETQGDCRRIAARLRAAARRIANGEKMYARIGKACDKCDCRRLCRRDHWQADEGGAAFIK